jgi:hypothetical protein
MYARLLTCEQIDPVDKMWAILTGHAEWDEESGTCPAFSSCPRLKLIDFSLPMKSQYRSQKNRVLGLKGRLV